MQKKKKNVFSFIDKCMLIGCFKLCILRRDFLPSTVNVLTKSPIILHITKRKFFKLSFRHSNQ